MRLWYLSHRRPAKAQASLCIRAVSPEPSLFAYMKYGSRQSGRPKIRHLASLDCCACAFEDWIYGGRKVPKSHELAHMVSNWCMATYSCSRPQRSSCSKSPTLCDTNHTGRRTSHFYMCQKKYHLRYSWMLQNSPDWRRRMPQRQNNTVRCHQ